MTNIGDRMRLCLVALVLMFACGGDGYSRGAPPKTCETLQPQHRGVVPQKSSSPYTLSASKLTVRKGESLSLMLTSPQGIKFKGFLLQARAPGSMKALGTFTEFPNNTKTMSCSGDLENTVTHTDPDPKDTLKFLWQAPADYDGDVSFNATVVQDFNTFWPGITTNNTVQVVDHTGDSSSHSVGISTTKSPVTTARPTTTPQPFSPEPEVKAAIGQDPIYDGCFKTKTCFGDSNNCVDMGNCKAVVSCLVKGSNYEFEIKASGANYVAVGLSNDGSMGEDSVVECVADGTGNTPVNTYMSWNVGKKNQRLSSSDAVQLITGSRTDGGVYCKFTREEVTEVLNRTYDLSKTQYFLLLAAGGGFSENGVGFHDVLYVPTGEAKFLSDVSGYQPASKLLLRLHGAFMVGAWIGTASLGILLARYFKQTWVGKQLCGKDQWFAWHRMFMVLTWSLTIAGFVIIFVYLGEWSHADNPHAILGLITTILAFFQPIGAAFRPHPDSRRRPIFNWLHWLVGNVAHILAIVTIFFAGQLEKAQLKKPEWLVLGLLVAYVAFHVLMHLMLSIAGCVSECHNSKRINSFPMKDIGNSRSPLQSAERRQDAPHSCFRKFLLAIYILGILALTTALIVIIVLAPIEEHWERVQKYIYQN